MRFVDSNVVLRLILEDDAAQFEAAYRELQRGDLALTLAVIVEVEWVLRGGYRWKRTEILQAIRAFADLSSIRIADEAGLQDILDDYARGMDMTDALHLLEAKRARAAEFLTFDREFARLAQDEQVPVTLLR